MSRFALCAAFGLTLALGGCADVGDAPEATTTAVDADATPLEFVGTPLAIAPSDSTVAWTAAKVTGRHVGGFGNVRGTLYATPDAVTGADITIATASIFSDSDRLTDHLRSPDFFEVETYPEASFRTTEIRPLTDTDAPDWAGATHVVTGVLTMHGASNQLEFPAQIEVDGASARVVSSFNINRQDWGLSYPGKPDDLIQDQVNLRIDLQAETSDTPELDV